MYEFQEYDLNQAPNELAREIFDMANKDQKARFSHANPEEIKRIDINNTKRLKEIIKNDYYPTISEIGEEASHLFWLLIQHADLDPEFQEECLSLMKNLREGEISKKHIAYLEDRVRVHNGLPTLYGTQFYRKEDGKIYPREIEDEENVNERRKELEMNTIEEYRKEFYSKGPKEDIPEKYLTE